MVAQPTETFEYDDVGNRVLRDGQSTPSTIGDGNRLLEDQNYTYSYDASGNMIAKTAKVSGAVTTYVYDAEDQLVCITFPDSTSTTYRYDALGRRIVKNVNGVETRYVYDNEDMVLEFDGGNVLHAQYTHGPGIDEPITMRRGGTDYYYQADGLGSVIELTDNSGASVRSYVYDSFGNIVAQNGSLKNPYTYTGREFDEESGLYYYRARYYDPVIGRFLQEDPVGYEDDLNLYQYVFNSPVNYVDPYGEFAQALALGATANPVGLVVVGVILTGTVIYAGYKAFFGDKTCTVQFKSDSSKNNNSSDIREGHGKTKQSKGKFKGKRKEKHQNPRSGRGTEKKKQKPSWRKWNS